MGQVLCFVIGWVLVGVSAVSLLFGADAGHSSVEGRASKCDGMQGDDGILLLQRVVKVDVTARTGRAAASLKVAKSVDRFVAFNCVFSEILTPTSAWLTTLAAVAIIGMVCVSLARASSGTWISSTNRSTATTKGGGTILALDGLRTLFVFTVICDHQKVFVWTHVFYDVSRRLMPFFFILSGFIRHTATGQESFNRATSMGYAARVLARFAPAYEVALLICMRFSIEGGPLIGWPLSALFLQTWLPRALCFPDGHFIGWFVSDIVFCALCFPFLYNWRPKGTIKQVVVALTTVLGLHAACCIAFPTLSYSFPLVRLLEFVLGILTAQLVDESPQWLREWLGWPWVFDGCLVMVFLVWEVSRFLSGSGRDTPMEEVLSEICWCVLLVAARCAVECPDSHGILLHALGCRPLVFLAKYSFGAYIYQDIVGMIMGALALQIRGQILNTISGVWLPFMIAMLSEHLLEAPVRAAVEGQIVSLPPKQRENREQPTA